MRITMEGNLVCTLSEKKKTFKNAFDKTHKH